MSDFLIEARDLELGYGGRVVLRASRLGIGSGRNRVVGFRGANGAGKSTFLRACLGLHPRMAGELELLGSAPGSRGFRSVLARVGYAPQTRAPGRLRLSVAEAIELGRYGRLRPFRAPGPRDRRAVRSAMELAGISDLAGRSVQELSGGQYQRVSIARALAAEPELLMLDEPGSHLDAEGRAQVVQLVATVAREGGGAMVLVSHDPELIALCDTIVDFRDGLAGEAER